MTFGTGVLASEGYWPLYVTYYALTLIIFLIFQLHPWNPLLWCWASSANIFTKSKCINIYKSLTKHSAFKCFASLMWKYFLIYWQTIKKDALGYRGQTRFLYAFQELFKNAKRQSDKTQNEQWTVTEEICLCSCLSLSCWMIYVQLFPLSVPHFHHLRS